LLSFGAEAFVLLSAIQIYKDQNIQNYDIACFYWSLSLREEHRLRIFENTVPRNVFGPKRDEVTGVWTRLRNEELNDVYSSPNIIWVIRSRRVRWAEHVSCMGDRRVAYMILVGDLMERDLLEDPAIDGSVILQWIFKKWAGQAWISLYWLKI
jgi:hypothetical protein